MSVSTRDGLRDYVLRDYGLPGLVSGMPVILQWRAACCCCCVHVLLRLLRRTARELKKAKGEGEARREEGAATTRKRACDPALRGG
jgi:hypothetical protein